MEDEEPVGPLGEGIIFMSEGVDEKFGWREAIWHSSGTPFQGAWARQVGTTPFSLFCSILVSKSSRLGILWGVWHMLR